MRIRGIELSRGIAALLVVVYHTTQLLADRPPFGGFFHFGHAGVEFFFVLSGFIITYVHGDDAGRPPEIYRYSFKRLTRIYPTYWAVFALYEALFLLSPTKAGLERQAWPLIRSFFLLPSSEYPIVGVAWTLSYELLFYGLFAILLLHRRLGMAVLAVWLMVLTLVATETAVQGTAPIHVGLGAVLLSPYNFCFFFGIGVAILARRDFVLRPFPFLFIGCVIFLAAGAWEWWAAAKAAWSLVYGAASALIVYGLATAETHGRLPSHPAWSIAGEISYPLYLTHMLVLLVVLEMLKRLGWLQHLPAEAIMAGLLIAAIMFAYLFHVIVERPLLRWCREMMPRLTPPAVRPETGPGSSYERASAPILSPHPPAEQGANGAT